MPIDFSKFKKVEEVVRKPKPKTIRATKPETIPIITTTDFDINTIFTKIATGSDFKRAIYNAITGSSHRGSKEDLDIQLSSILKKVRTK